MLVAFYDRREDGWSIRRRGTIGRIEGTAVALGPDFALSPAFPPVVGQDPIVSRTFMGSYDQVVADSRFFYTTWGDNRDPHLTHDHQPDVRFAKIPVDMTDRSADLAVSVTDSPDPAYILDTVTHNVTVTNTGPDDASFTSLTAILPHDFSLISATSTQGSCFGTPLRTVSCSLGTLPAGATATVVLRSDSGVAQGPATITVNAGSLVPDPSPANDTASATTTVRLRPGTDVASYTAASPAPIAGIGVVEIPLAVWSQRRHRRCGRAGANRSHVGCRPGADPGRP
jgi:uncharacterized repeat protein (TIGR01451 family)